MKKYRSILIGASLGGLVVLAAFRDWRIALASALFGVMVPLLVDLWFNQ